MKTSLLSALVTLIVTVTLSCSLQKDAAVPVVQKHSGARSEAGLSWSFHTPNEYDSNEYYATGSARQYYVKKSQSYSRLVTFTVTNRTTGQTANPTFQIYVLYQNGCATISSVSAPGNYTYQAVNSDNTKYKIYTWSPGNLTYGQSATFSYYIHLDVPNGCVEGGFNADLIYPSTVVSSQTYAGGDRFDYVSSDK